jgi:hypothetical protein
MKLQPFKVLEGTRLLKQCTKRAYLAAVRIETALKREIFNNKET